MGPISQEDTARWRPRMCSLNLFLDVLGDASGGAVLAATRQEGKAEWEGAKGKGGPQGDGTSDRQLSVCVCVRVRVSKRV